MTEREHPFDKEFLPKAGHTPNGDPNGEAVHCVWHSHDRIRAFIDSYVSEQIRQAKTSIRNKCPSCDHRSLFIGAGGWLTCGNLECGRSDVDQAIEHKLAMAELDARAEMKLHLLNIVQAELSQDKRKGE